MTLQLDLTYTNSYGDTKLNGKIEENNIESGDLPFDEKTIIVLSDTKDGVVLAMSGPQIITHSNLTHEINRGFSKGSKAEKVNIGILKYNNYYLLILLHKAIIQCDMGTGYVLQILKKIEELEENDFEGEYKGYYSNFTNIDIRENSGILKIDEETLQKFISGIDVEGYSGSSAAKIIRV